MQTSVTQSTGFACGSTWQCLFYFCILYSFLHSLVLKPCRGSEIFPPSGWRLSMNFLLDNVWNFYNWSFGNQWESIESCKYKNTPPSIRSISTAEATWRHLIWLSQWTLEWHVQVLNLVDDSKQSVWFSSLAGVAYASPSTVRQTPRVIQNWPGRSHRDENKVPTSLVYNLDSLRETETTVSSWGFQCNETESNDPTKILRHLFKTLLETQNLVKKNQELVLADNPTYSEADVTRWFEDYLRNIYRHIEQEMSRRNATRFWGTSTVVFIFSVPTTWSSHEMIERKFKGSLFRAGFGSGGTKHTVEVDLTEAEAAAVYTVDAGQSYKVSLFMTNREVLLTWLLLERRSNTYMRCRWRHNSMFIHLYKAEYLRNVANVW